MKISTKQFVAQGVLMSMCVSMFGGLNVAAAASPGDVVINEVAWAGSADSSSDEWIELYNPSSSPVDLSNWVIDDDNGASTYTIGSGTIPAKGYFLIESREDAVKGVAADAVISLSLANSGDSLVLKDSTGNAIDTVNSTGGAWFAGGGSNKASMERIDASGGGDVSTNWAANVTSSGAKASGDSAIYGTPGGQNSVAQVSGGADVTFVPSNLSPAKGDTVTVMASIDKVTDLFAYGFDVTYDAQVLEFVSATKKDFLSETGSVTTSFQAGLENSQPGKIVIAEARTVDPKTTVSGKGDLFELSFKVTGAEGAFSTLACASSCFVADAATDIPANYDAAKVTVKTTQADPVTNLAAKEGANRYEIDLSWDAPGTGADSYIVYRKNFLGDWVTMDTVTTTSFTDKDGMTGGGAIVPHVEYEYRVIAVKGAVNSAEVSVKGKETRGVKGDVNRSDRVDGRDLELLARHFGQTHQSADFKPLVDTTYDGTIDGNDLLDLTAQWAVTYSN